MHSGKNGKNGETSRLKNGGGGFLILIPWPPIKLQKDFQEQVKEPCCHHRSSSSAREGCVGVHISTAQGCSSFLYSHVEVQDFSQSVTVAWLCLQAEKGLHCSHKHKLLLLRCWECKRCPTKPETRHLRERPRSGPQPRAVPLDRLTLPVSVGSSRGLRRSRETPNAPC